MRLGMFCTSTPRSSTQPAVAERSTPNAHAGAAPQHSKRRHRHAASVHTNERGCGSHTRPGRGRDVVVPGVPVHSSTAAAAAVAVRAAEAPICAHACVPAAADKGIPGGFGCGSVGGFVSGWVGRWLGGSVGGWAGR
eukprot:364372-Chlamydomonas_euryale.AAC.16